MPDDADIFIGETIRGFASGQKVFGRYHLTRLLGRGGMGVVWLAHDKELDRDVALKFVPELLTNDQTAIAELKRETRRSLDLTHPNIVRVYDFLQDENLAAISMEYIDGQTLADMRATRPHGAFEPADLERWIGHLCAALDHAHNDAHIVHRDLKPANMMVDSRGRMKITDFGISATVSETVTRVTQIASTSGTLTYMSPQQMLGQAPTFSDDIYSLGAVLYDLLTGKPPFFRGNIALQVEKQPPTEVTARRNEFEIPGEPIPERWEKTIAACLAKDPAFRPGSAREVAAGIASEAGPTPAPPPIPVQKKGSRWMSWTAAALIALIAGAGAAYHFGWYPAEWDALPARLAKADQDPPGTAKASETQPVLEPPEETAKAVDDETSIDFFTPVDDTTLVSESTPDAPPPGEDSTADLTDTPQPTADDQPPVGDAAATDEVETAVAPPEPTPPPPSDFVVQVDPPVAGARVWLGPRADLAVDANGRLVLRDLPIGGHDLTVQAPGHRAHTTRVEITSDGGSSRVTLEPLLATIAVSARPGTVISAVDANGRIAPLGSTGESGTFNGSDILPVGRYSMLFEHPDCAPVQMKDVELTATRRGTFAPEQQPLPGELRVLTNPDGAEVRLNGQAVGFTPLMLTELPSEVGVRIDVASPGFQELTQEVTLRPRETRLLNFGTLVADSGAVRFELSPPNFDIGNARMLVDDEDVVPRLDGSTWRIDGLVPGSHKIEIIHPDFVPWSQQIAVVNGRTTSLPVRFSAKMATVRLRVSGAPSFVLSVDGRQVDARSEAVSIPSGRDVRLEVTANGFRPASRVLHLAPDASETWAVELQRMDRAVEGEPFLALSVGLQMAWIPPGRFVMGSPQSESGPDSDERPLTRVKLTRGYWMGSTEVTQAQWSAVMDQNPSFFRTNTRAPVDSITWEEAVMFCRRLTQNERAAGRLPYNYSFALPTEAQWEYACRAGTTSAFHGDLGAIAWWKVKNTQPVGEKQPNAWGLHDMHGNVAEWTSSWYGNYPGGERTDYAGPGGGRVRVFRGGSIDSNEHSLRSAYRNWVSPATRDEVIGFRVALVRE